MKALSSADAQVLICDGSECRSAGSRELRREIRQWTREHKVGRRLALIRTKCLGHCTSCPVVGVLPANVWISDATKKRVFRALDAAIFPEPTPNSK